MNTPMKKYNVASSKEEWYEFLEHYASPYYDPAKAHEYYERTKEVKGRRSSSSLNKEGKEVWAVTKSNIQAEKKAKTEANRAKQQAERESIRAVITQERERIKAELKAKLEEITERINKRKADAAAKTQRREEDVRRKRMAEEERVHKQLERRLRFATGPEQKRQYERIANQELASIKKEANAEIDIIQYEGQKAQQNAGQEASQKDSLMSNAAMARQAASDKLKTTLETIRTKAKETQEALKQTTEATLDSEYNKILESYRAETSKKQSAEQTVDTNKPTRSTEEILAILREEDEKKKRAS